MKSILSHLDLILLSIATASTGALLGVLIALSASAPYWLTIVTSACCAILILAWPAWRRGLDRGKARIYTNGCCSACGQVQPRLWTPPVQLPIWLCDNCTETIAHWCRQVMQQISTVPHSDTPDTSHSA